jgi:hypothetical protein
MRVNYILINPDQKQCHLAACSSIEEAYSMVELKTDTEFGVDHAVVWRSPGLRSLSIAVEGCSLLDGADRGLFSLAGRLLAGPAVLYACDEAGETVSAVMGDLPPLTWYQNARAAELAICHGEIERPRIRIGDQVLWEWPQPGGVATCQRAAEMAADHMLSSFFGNDTVMVILG